MSSISTNVRLSGGLTGQDEHLHALEQLFEQLQVATVDAGDPTIDLLTFADTVYYFGVILKEKLPVSGENDVLGIGIGSSSDDMYYPQEPPQVRENPIGIIYLNASQRGPSDSLHFGELRIGLIIHPEYRQQGCARRAIELALEIAFADARCHRVQALIQDRWSQVQALNLFTKMGFEYEGTRRRAFFGSFDQEWKDATYMAIMATDWALYHIRSAPSKTLWDEMFYRHQREREDLLRSEQRTAMETIYPDQEVSEVPQLVTTPPIKRTNKSHTGKMPSDAYDGGISSSEADSEMDTETETETENEADDDFVRAQPPLFPDDPQPTVRAPSPSLPPPDSPTIGYETSTSTISDWDLVESADSSGYSTSTSI